MSDTKACPFCGEEILAVAIKCKHCHSDLTQSNNSTTASDTSSVMPSKASGTLSDSPAPHAKPEPAPQIFKPGVSFGELFKAIFVLGFAAIVYFYFFPDDLQNLKFWENQQQKRIEAIKSLEAATIISSDSSEHYETFVKGTKATDVQRNEIVNKLKGGVVVWDVKVYEVKKVKNAYRIQANEGEEKPTSGLGAIVQGVREGMGDKAFHGVCANADVYTRDEKDEETLKSLKTGDVVGIRGVVAGVKDVILQRCFKLAPAVLEIQKAASQKSDLPIKKEMGYSEARDLLLKAGWVAVANPGSNDLFGMEKDVFDKGFREVEGCAGSAPVCNFKFQNSQGKIVQVTALYNENDPDIAKAKVTGWSLQTSDPISKNTPQQPKDTAKSEQHAKQASAIPETGNLFEKYKDLMRDVAPKNMYNDYAQRFEKTTSARKSQGGFLLQEGCMKLSCAFDKAIIVVSATEQVYGAMLRGGNDLILIGSKTWLVAPEPLKQWARAIGATDADFAKWAKQ